MRRLEDCPCELQRTILGHYASPSPKIGNLLSKSMIIMLYIGIFSVFLCFHLRIQRDCNETCTIKGVTIPNGMPILAPIYAIHHDPEIYPDPEKFDPER